MSEEFQSKDEVILVIENTPVKCKKEELIKHSDYFKVMFEGCFLERDKKVVKLEGVSLKAINIILTMLWDKTSLVDEEDIPCVLQASSMLQFVEIKEQCVQKLIDLLHPRNCIKVWVIAEQLDMQSLFLKAKCMALTEFDCIKYLDCVLELDLKQLCCYLGNTNLLCRSELDILQTGMKWWYENSEKCKDKMTFSQTEQFNSEVFVSLLSCLDFNSLTNSDIQEIMMYPDLSSNTHIMNILQCLLDLKRGNKIDYNEHILNKAKTFSKSRPRNRNQYPCILVGSLSNEHARKRQKLSSSEKDVPVVFYDNFKRKRYYTNIETSEAAVALVYYNSRKNDFIKFLTIGKQKCGNLDGFKIVGYKEFIFLFGGEFLIGKGNWNKNFWVYDTIRECWERKSVIPFVRRHFEACICGNDLYIIGGTGSFRVIQDNLFWYNYKEDKWSGQVALPFSDRQIQCCSWNGQLFLLNLNNRCGYLFNQEKSTWSKLDIDQEQSVSVMFPDKYTVFQYEASIYIKSHYVIQLKIENQKLVITSCTMFEPLSYDHIESVICGNFLYTMYRQTCPDEETSTITFEKYCMTSQRREFIFKDTFEGTLIKLDGIEYVFRSTTSLFGFQHHELVANDVFVNDL